MAMIECPNCKRQISEYAHTCPKCGLNVQEAMSAARIKDQIDHMRSQVDSYVEKEQFAQALDTLKELQSLAGTSDDMNGEIQEINDKIRQAQIKSRLQNAAEYLVSKRYRDVITECNVVLLSEPEETSAKEMLVKANSQLASMRRVKMAIFLGLAFVAIVIVTGVVITLVHKQSRSSSRVTASHTGKIRILADSTAPQDNYFTIAMQKAKIRIDDGQWSQVDLPLVKAGIACGLHRVELQIQGYMNTQAKSIEVKENQVSDANFRLTPKPSSVTIDSNVSGAEVFDITGRKLGQAGMRLELEPFVSHSLVIRAPNNLFATIVVQLDEPGTHSEKRSVSLKQGNGPVLGKSWSVTNPHISFVYVAPGSFRMGSNSGAADEKPVHTVEIRQGYWIGKYEVTQSQYQSIMGDNPSLTKASSNPVEDLMWNEAVSFCMKLSVQERLAGRLLEGYEYRLPTEAEWEFAARGGNSARNTEYAGSNRIDEVGWYRNNVVGRAQQVGQKQSNELGIYDMTGNVHEWCLDSCFFDKTKGVTTNTYRNGVVDPINRTGTHRVFRGGCWSKSDPFYCRIANREAGTPDGYKTDSLGFRLVLAPILSN